MLVISIQLARAETVTAGTATKPHRAAVIHIRPILGQIGARRGFPRAESSEQPRWRAGLRF